MDLFDGSKTVPMDTLGSPQTNLPGTMAGESLSVPIIVTPTQLYGKSQDTLDASIALRNLPSSSKCKIGTGTITATGTLAITGVGFRPTSITIICNNSGLGYCTGYGDGTSYFVNYWDGTGTGMSSSYIIWFRDTAATKCQGTLTSLDADGFTLNISFKSLNTPYSYIAYG